MVSPARVRTLAGWAAEAVSFSLERVGAFEETVDVVLASLGEGVDVLALGEPTHGIDDFLVLRNRLFQYLVDAHGYSAIAIESSYPRGHLVDSFITGRGPATYDQVQHPGFSHGFGELAANRELVEWMRRRNAERRGAVELRFYGFDSPTEMTGADSPRQLLEVALDYLAALDPAGDDLRERITPLLGEDASWSDAAAAFDPTKSVGVTAAANALRVETEELISELRIRRPALVAASSRDAYLTALQHARMARQLLSYHAALARPAGQRIGRLLGIRDAIMADTLAHVVAREQDRGKVLVFAHNSHLQRGQARWQLGGDLQTWWPAGAHLHELLGSRYAAIAAALGADTVHGFGEPEPTSPEGTVVATAPGPGRLIATRSARSLSPEQFAALTTRTTPNPSYIPLTAQSLTDFDWLAVLDSTG